MDLKDIKGYDDFLFSEFEQYFQEYVKNRGMGGISKKDLDAIINHCGIIVLESSPFANLYKIKSADDTNITMKKWTKAIGLMTLVILIFTILMYMRGA